MNRLLPALAAAALLLAAASCNNKDYNPGNPAPQPVVKKTIQDIYNQLRPQTKSVSIDAATGGTFRGNSGTRYQFPPNAFVTQAGLPVTGAVDVRVIEALTHSQMMFGKMLPVSNGQGLVSGGEARVQAFQNGQELRIAPGATYRINMPYGGANGANMQRFMGENTVDTTTTLVNWNPAPQDSVSSGAVVYNGDTLTIISDSLTWENCDYFSGNTNLQIFTVTVAGPDSLSGQNAATYALFDGLNTLMPIYPSAGMTYNINNMPNIPMHFICFAVVDGQFYGGILAATPTTGNTYTVTLTAQDPVAFAAAVDALP